LFSSGCRMRCGVATTRDDLGCIFVWLKCTAHNEVGVRIVDAGENTLRARY
jgi:hypothetical protein